MRLFRFFLTWWGMYLIAALDASMMFFLPFGVDAVVIFLAARDRELAWLYPLLATAGSLTGAAATYWIGQKIGEIGLARYVPSRIPALLPPPFPLTPFVLTCGALRVNPWRFFTAFGTMRLVRFGTEAALALVFGRKILQILRSDMFQLVIAGFIVLAVVGTIISAVLLWRSTRHQEVRT